MNLWKMNGVHRSLVSSFSKSSEKLSHLATTHKHKETLDDFVSLKERRKKIFKVNRARFKTKRENAKCPYKLLVVCSDSNPFYACSSKMENDLYDTFMRESCNDYPTKCESACEEEPCPFEMGVGHQVEEAINQTTFVSKKKKQWMAICKCRPIRKFEGIIQERQYLNDVSYLQPCEYRCVYTLKYGDCYYRKETRLKQELKRRKNTLDYYFKMKV